MSCFTLLDCWHGGKLCYIRDLKVFKAAVTNSFENYKLGMGLVTN